MSLECGLLDPVEGQVQPSTLPVQTLSKVGQSEKHIGHFDESWLTLG
jgi:hypothetical protein